MGTKKITLNELRSLVKKIIKEEQHLVNDIYSSDFIGKKMKYGSPGYPMIFIPREIEQISKTKFRFTGDMPQATIGTEGHTFVIDEKHLEELDMEGETYWIAKDGAHQYLSF